LRIEHLLLIIDPERSRSIRITTTTMTSTGSVVSVHDLTMEDVTHEPDGERASSPQPSPPEEERGNTPGESRVLW
jgi:hypothetical protein